MAIAELGSFAAAATRLHRSPAAVSTHVQKLESELGVRLLERTTRRVALTAEGRLLLGRCQVVMSELNDVSRELVERSELRAGHVSIGTVPSVSSHRLPHALAAFKALHPGITLKLHEGSASRIHDDLRDRVTDFAIAPEFGAHKDLLLAPVLIDPLVAILPHSVTVSTRGISLAELARYPQLAQPGDTAVRATVERAFRDKGLDFRPVIEVAHHQTLLNMVAAGLGITVLPTICVPMAANDGYQVVPLRPPIPSRMICVVTLRGRVLTGPSKVCVRLIVDALRQGDGAAQARRAVGPGRGAAPARPSRI